MDRRRQIVPRRGAIGENWYVPDCADYRAPSLPFRLVDFESIINGWQSVSRREKPTGSTPTTCHTSGTSWSSRDYGLGFTHCCVSLSVTAEVVPLKSFRALKLHF